MLILLGHCCFIQKSEVKLCSKKLGGKNEKYSKMQEKVVDTERKHLPVKRQNLCKSGNVNLKNVRLIRISIERIYKQLVSRVERQTFWILNDIDWIGLKFATMQRFCNWREVFFWGGIDLIMFNWQFGSAWAVFVSWVIYHFIFDWNFSSILRVLFDKNIIAQVLT